MSTLSDRRSHAAVKILLASILFVSVIIVSNYFFRSMRIDLTATKQYTLSQGTLNILKELDEPVTLRFFFSEKLANRYPQVRLYGERVRDLLQEYQVRAGGKLLLEIVDPEPFTEAEDRAVALGVQGIPTDTGDSLYFGLVGTNSVDGQEVISYFAQEREPYLEYDLTSLVYKLSRTKKPVVGLLSRLPLDIGLGGPMAVMQGQSKPFMIYEQLASSFDVRHVSPETDAIDDDLDVLMVVHPSNLPKKTLYAIDQFVLGGGRLLLFLDPLSEIVEFTAPMGQAMPGAARSSDLSPLLKAWGIEYDPHKVVADLARALRVQAGPEAGRPVSDYVIWLGLRESDLATDDLVTAEISLLNVASAGALAAAPGTDLTFIPLMQSTINSMLLDADSVARNINPDDLIVSFRATPDKYTLAARVTGQVKTAFPEGPPPKAEAEEDEQELEPEEAEEAPAPAQIKASEKPVNMIVVADTDLLDDRFWLREQSLLGQRVAIPTADNGAFVLNAVENLMGSDDLISLRSRGRDDRPLIAIENLRKQAEARFLVEQQRLETELRETENRLAQLQSGGLDDGQGNVLLTSEEEEEINRFRAKLLETRAALRAVQHNLRSDIEALENRIRFINIALMPILVAVFAVGLAVTRRRRRREMHPPESLEEGPGRRQRAG